jgi:DNA-binding transcriptional ArsR family regulator
MSRKARNAAAGRQRYAPIFAALGDETRLALVAKLCEGQPRSIVRLTKGTRLTRQAVTKHLRVLESARIVRRVRAGRESLFELDPARIRQVREYADVVSQQWDLALSRLKAFVEG